MRDCYIGSPSIDKCLKFILLSECIAEEVVTIQMRNLHISELLKIFLRMLIVLADELKCEIRVSGLLFQFGLIFDWRFLLWRRYRSIRVSRCGRIIHRRCNNRLVLLNRNFLLYSIVLDELSLFKID